MEIEKQQLQKLIEKLEQLKIDSLGKRTGDYRIAIQHSINEIGKLLLDKEQRLIMGLPEGTEIIILKRKIIVNHLILLNLIR